MFKLGRNTITLSMLQAIKSVTLSLPESNLESINVVQSNV